MSSEPPAAPSKPPANERRIRRFWRTLFRGWWEGTSKVGRVAGTVIAAVAFAGAVVGILAGLAALGVIDGGGSNTNSSGGSGGSTLPAPVKGAQGVTVYSIETGGTGASLRVGPTAQSHQLTRLQDGTKVRIICTKQGEYIEAYLGKSSLWDYVQPVGRSIRGYVFDGLVYTRVNGPVAHACP